MKMPNFSKISLLLVKFWGCPGFQPGRAVPGLAGLLGPSALRASVWPAATLIHPSAVAGQGLLWAEFLTPKLSNYLRTNRI